MPCQDFALSFADGSSAWAVVSDGCSTGGRTDIGARAWALAAESVLSRAGASALENVDQLAENLLEEAEPWLRKLAFEDGLATVGLLATYGDRATAVLFGDGVLVQRLRDDRLRIWNVSYTENAPRYLQYERAPAVLREWEKAYSVGLHQVVFTEYDISNGAPELLRLDIQTAACDEIRGFKHVFEGVADNTLGLMVMTDGAVSFEGLSPVQGVLPLVQVPNMAGQVTQRRLAALSRKWAKAGGAPGPVDDLAIGAIWLP